MNLHLPSMKYRDSFKSEDSNIAGSLIVATPSLQDAHFEKTVVLLVQQSKEEGALGIIYNRPLDCELGELNDQFANTELSKIKVYYGGPVSSNQILLAGMHITEDARELKIYFGMNDQNAAELISQHPEYEVRAYLGYSGWAAGQLEDEISQHAWTTVGLKPSTIKHLKNDLNAWQNLAGNDDSGNFGDFRFPKDPSLN